MALVVRVASVLLSWTSWTACLMALVVRVTSASVMIWWVWDGSSSLAICRVACSSVTDDAG
eukprot:scaffold5675_cov112-Skeletonema_dohrnii-CCMP3373.AAC.1